MTDSQKNKESKKPSDGIDTNQIHGIEQPETIKHRVTAIPLVRQLKDTWE